VIMTREQALTAVAVILDEVADVDPKDVSEEKVFADDLGVDSLAMVEVVVVAEDRFGIKIPDAESSSIKTVGDLVDRAVTGAAVAE
jgi:acyl carrier protein